MIESLLTTILNIAIVIMVSLIVLSTYRIWKGPTSGDRVLANDLLTNLIIGVIVLLAAIEQNELLIDVGIALAAFSFIGTLAIARYMSEGRPF